MDAAATLAEALGDRYRLEEEIGRGGMATVYRARDLRHGRDVAIKLLSPEFPTRVGAERFLREIELAAGLSHANILPVHDSGRVGELLWFAMPYVDGETLRQRVAREGRLPVRDAVRIASEVADALDFAHRQGILHRDVKPGNILLSDEHAYVMDFGVARAMDVEAGEHLTETGLAVGTPAYMSPEQAAGERGLTARSDVYSLGCVLYEMLSGQLPFEGTSPQAVLVRRLTDDPAPIRSLRREVPPAVERALTKAMAREPNDRFGTAAEFRDALDAAVDRGAADALASVARRAAWRARASRRAHPVLVPLGVLLLAVGAATVAWRLGRSAERSAAGEAPTVPSAPSELRIAVLPPRVLPASAELEAYGEALTDELIHRLGGLEEVRVPSFRTVRSFEDDDVPPDSIGRALGVEYVVEGTLLGEGDSLRLNLSLVNATDGSYVAGSRHEATKGQILALVDTVTSDVAFSLRRELGREFRVRELRAETDDPRAWLALREAEQERERAIDAAAEGGPGRDRALALLDRSDSLLAVAAHTDPAWPEPDLQRGWNLLERAMAEGAEAQEFGPEDEGALRAAVEAADRVLRRDAGDADGLALKGTAIHGLAAIALDPAERVLLDAEAERLFRAAIEANPRQVQALRGLADQLRFHAGDSEGALAMSRRAYEADLWHRDAAELLATIAELNTDLDRYDAARTVLQEGRRRWPDDVTFPALELLVLASVGTNVDSAWAVADTISALAAIDRTDAFRRIMEAQVATVIERAGLRDSAVSVLERTERLARDAGHDTIAAYDLAHAWLVVGDTARALDWLALDLAADPGSRAMRAEEPWFRPLHGNPRFEELVGR